MTMEMYAASQHELLLWRPGQSMLTPIAYLVMQDTGTTQCHHCMATMHSSSRLGSAALYWMVGQYKAAWHTSKEAGMSLLQSLGRLTQECWILLHNLCDLAQADR